MPVLLRRQRITTVGQCVIERRLDLIVAKGLDKAVIEVKSHAFVKTNLLHCAQKI